MHVSLNMCMLNLKLNLFPVELKHFIRQKVWHEISNNVVCATIKAPDQPAHTRSLIRAFASRLNSLSVKLLTEHHLEFQSLKGDCTGSSESTLVKMPNCWKLHVTALFISTGIKYLFH